MAAAQNKRDGENGGGLSAETIFFFKRSFRVFSNNSGFFFFYPGAKTLAAIIFISKLNIAVGERRPSLHLFPGQ